MLRLDEGLATAVSAEASAEGSLAEVRAAEGDAEDEVEADSQGLTEGRMDIVIEKTFFHVREPDCARTSYTKSTTDAHGVAFSDWSSFWFSEWLGIITNRYSDETYRHADTR